MNNWSTAGGWTDERTELLTKLWRDGLSAPQIAKQLGGVTRNAVIGKAHRLGLGGRAEPSAPRARAPEVTRAPHQNNGLNFKNKKSLAGAADHPWRGSAETKAAPEPISEKRISAWAAVAVSPRPWETRGSYECAAPVGGDGADTLSCCNRHGRVSWPYCDGHLALMGPKPAERAAPKSNAAAAERARLRQKERDAQRWVA